MTDTSEEAARRRAQEQLTAATSAMVTQGNIEAEKAEAKKKAKAEAKKKVGSVWVVTGGLTEHVKRVVLSACPGVCTHNMSMACSGTKVHSKDWGRSEGAQQY